jgi:hypothetical protein
MDRNTFEKLVYALDRLDAGAGEIAAPLLGLLLAAGVLGGFWLARWVFRGGLSRCTFRVRKVARASSPNVAQIWCRIFKDFRGRSIEKGTIPDF